MGSVIPKAVLLLCFAALVLVACSEEREEQDPGQTEATSAGGAGEAAKVRTVPKRGVLAPGRYFTGEEFKPPFSFELDEGWRVLPDSGPYSFRLGYITPGREVAEGKALRFLNVREVFKPRTRGDEVSFEAKRAPEDLAGWLERHPYLSTDDPEPADVGGVAGKRLGVEVDVPEGYRDTRGGCPVPCIPLFRLGGDSVTRITGKGRHGFVVLGEEAVVVIVSAPVAGFDEFLPEAQKVLETVEWGGP